MTLILVFSFIEEIKMRVMKFGGTSVKDAAAIERLSLIAESREGGLLIVVSALSGVTNSLVSIIGLLDSGSHGEIGQITESIRERHMALAEKLDVKSETESFIRAECESLKQIALASEILGEVSPKAKGLILSKGEKLSSFIIFNALKRKRHSISHVDAAKILKTNSNFNEAEVDFAATAEALQNEAVPLFRQSRIVITGGFYGSDSTGRITTLGRGGSDYSAAVFASLLKASTLEIWTDVDGILTSDPRMIPNARLIKEVTYTEASELAFFGAKVLHPKTIYPAVQQNIPVYVLNSFKPEGHGTKILDIPDAPRMLKAIAFRKGITVINVHSNRMLGTYGFLSKVFDIFNQYRTPVDIVTTSEVSISLTIDDESRMASIISELEKFAAVSIYRDKALICMVGEGIRDTAGIASRFFGVLQGINISMVSVGASEVNISVIIDSSLLEQAVRLLHEEFFGDKCTSELFEPINGAE